MLIVFFTQAIPKHFIMKKFQNVEGKLHTMPLSPGKKKARTDAPEEDDAY
jgi:hypothetical protein